MGRHLNSVRVESATRQVTLTQMRRMVNEQFKQLGKVVTARATGAMKTKGETMDKIVTEIEEEQIREIRGRRQNPKAKSIGRADEQTPSSGANQSRPTSDYSEKDILIRAVK